VNEPSKWISPFSGSETMKRCSVLSPQFLDEVEKLLDRFYDMTGVTIVMLIDVSGQLISYKGNPYNVNLSNLAALIAGDMAAVNEMARQIGEPDRFKLLFHEGENHIILISALKGSFLLVSIFKTSVQIGLVRLFTKETMIRLMRIIEEIGASDQVEQIVDASFTTSLADELERAFGE